MNIHPKQGQGSICYRVDFCFIKITFYKLSPIEHHRRCGVNYYCIIKSMRDTETDLVDEKELQKKEKINDYLVILLIIIILVIYSFIWIWGNNIVADSCTHLNCTHGWYSKYNDTEKMMAILSRIVSLPILYLIGVWVMSFFPKINITCAKCGSKMSRKHTGGIYHREYFYGCSMYPKCTGRRNILK